ncbi:MAG: endonuclease MutS2 [Balneola sp.]|nr:MAG: endonuclease MutS2 [Balneola sp.]
MKLYPPSIVEKLGFEQLREATLKVSQSELARETIARLSPSNHPDFVRTLLSQTGEMIDVLRDPDPFPLGEVPDIRDYMSIAKPQGSILSLHAFPEILSVCTTSRLVKKYFKSRIEHKLRLYAISETIIPLKDLEASIKQKVTDGGELKDDASPELKSIRKRLNSKKNELRSTVNKLMRNATKDGMTSDEGATIRNGRMVIPILVEYKRKIQGFIHDVSSTGQTVYLEPAEALHLNNEIRQFEAEEQREIERILRELTNHVRINREYLQQNLDALAMLDVIASKAKVSLSLDAEISITSTSRRLSIKQGFNANLLLKNNGLKKDERTDIIPLDLQLDENERCLMITGPNAGGKSVAMKTVGIFALMQQSGYAIPADPTSELPIFSGIFVDLGDDQSIENDLSTFSSRLQWMRETQKNLTPGSLILIDEAAAGTDPEEGGALFQSFIEYLLQKECTVLVTTHHGSLKVFAHEHPLAVNGSMEFDQASLSPTYKFKKGIPGSSYAFEIAERMQLDEDILSRSRELLGEQKNKMESLISELEAKTQDAEELKSTFEQLKSKAETDRNRYLNKLDGLNREKEKIREKALIEAKSIMDKANQKVEKAVEQIIEQKKTNKKEIKDIREDIDQEKQKIESKLEEVKEKREATFRKSKQPPKVGDYVRFLDGNTTGQLIEQKGNNATVQADGLRLRTKYKNLVKVEPPKKKKEKKARASVLVGDAASLKEMVSPRLDLRGKRADEALNEVTHYLDKAVFRGLNQVEIVHGKGDGILKEQIHKYLKDRTEVKHFELAHEDHGGAGVTVVNF